MFEKKNVFLLFRVKKKHLKNDYVPYALWNNVFFFLFSAFRSKQYVCNSIQGILF